MNDLTELLDDFTWENFTDISNSLVRFDERHIDDEMLRQASIYSYYHGLMVAAKRRMNDLETDLTRLTAQLRSGHKHSTPTKLTAKDLDDLVESDEAYVSGSKDVNDATFKYELIRGLVKALEQKKDMLVQVSSNKRAETKLY